MCSFTRCTCMPTGALSQTWHIPPHNALTQTILYAVFTKQDNTIYGDFLRIIMPLSFIAILTFELLNSFTWQAFQWLWTKLMYSHFKILQWMTYLWPRQDNLLPFLTFELKLRTWPWRYRHNSFARHTVKWWWTKEPTILKSHNKQHSYCPDKLNYGHFLPLNSNCALVLGNIDVILSPDTLFNDGEQMCQMILKSHNKKQSYGPDKHLTFELPSVTLTFEILT